MRKSTNRLIAFLFLLLPLVSLAQTSITGKVVRDDGSPVEGASVTIKGKTTGTKTDSKGNFTLTAAQGDVLVISSVNFTTQQIKVQGAAPVSVKLKANDNKLDEVVVTAMDIKRNSRELGYSAQTVKGSDIQQTQRENFVNSLQGRVAGLTVTPTTGAAGASSSIVLRGFNSSGTNQPLFVVDGVILDNQTMDETSNTGTGLGLASDRPNRASDYTNRIADLNPNDIATVTVLKGPEATALYGSQASSGAIVITTKKPTLNGKLGIIYDNNFRFQTVNRFPELVTAYGPGTNGNASSTTFTDFGPALGKDAPTYDNMHHLFQTGFAQTHNLSLSYGKKNIGTRFSGSYFEDHGVVPNNVYKKFNFTLNNTIKLGKYIDINPSVSYINSTNDKPLRGSGGYLLDLYAFPVTRDIRNYQDASGKRIFALPGNDPSVETDNPLFNVYNDRGHDLTDRFVATLGIDIRPTKWLSVSGRFGYDTYKTNGYNYYDPQSSTSVGIGGTTQGAYVFKGALDNYYRRYEGYNHTIYATAKKTLGKFSGRLIGGTMWQDYETRMFAIVGSQLITPGHTDSSNTNPATRQRLLRNYYGQYNESIIREMAYFGEADLSYNNMVFFSLTHRWESASVFPVKNRNYDYPGASVSAIMTDIFPAIKSNFLTYAKLRASFANVARLPDPYLNQSVFGNNFASATGPAYSYGFNNNNPDLRPERQRTFEVGTELRMLNGRLTIDGAYYNTYCYDQISQNARASYGTGFVLNTLNAASLRNEGFELTVDINPIKKKDFSWDINFNFNHTWSNVIDLPLSIGPLNDYYNSDNLIYNARGGFVRGHPTTTITGYNYARNNKGQILINPSTGLPVINATFMPIGDRNPDFTLGTLNNFRYKSFNLSFLWDLKVGGDIFNGTDEYLTNLGRSARTADRMTARVIQGVLNDGLQNTSTPTKNTISVIPYYNSTAYYGGIPEEEFMEHDINWLRLRDITLSYLLPQRIISKVKGLKTLSVFATASDLVLITNYTGGDPAVSATSAATRGVGSFGYDYGNLPTPRQLSFGIRANF